jgi:hypothetical protein
MTFETPRAGTAINARLTELKAEERYARERYQLYKAKAYGSRLTSPGRLRELERRSKLAKRRLETALRFNSGEPDHRERESKRSSTHTYDH